MIEAIRLTGMFGLPGLILYLSYLFYEKNVFLTAIFIFFGLVLACFVIGYEIYFKYTKYETLRRYGEFKDK